MSHYSARSKEGTDYYTILGLSKPQRAADTHLTVESLKSAYRRALLLYHPDKVDSRDQGRQGIRGTRIDDHFTVDQIVEAYQTLADPISRLKYNKALANSDNRRVTADKSSDSAGLDTFDLEDLDYDGSRSWSKSCRCGGTYLIDEQQLEDAASDGEVIASCQGCSLRIRVTFSTVDGGPVPS